MQVDINRLGAPTSSQQYPCSWFLEFVCLCFVASLRILQDFLLTHLSGQFGSQGRQQQARKGLLWDQQQQQAAAAWMAGSWASLCPPRPLRS